MRRRLPSLNGLRAFAAAARHESFSKAAEELHVTPAAVSQQVAALEEHLGIRLFERFNRAVRITEAGRAALPDLERGFELLERGVARAEEAGSRGALGVSAAPSFAGKWLVQRLDEFNRRMPDIDVVLSAQYELPDFRAGEVDVAVHFGDGSYPEGLHAERLFPVALVPVCSPALVAGMPPLHRPEDLVGHRLLHDDALRQDPDRPGWSDWLEAAGVEGVETARGSHFSHTLHALEAALDGQGVLLAIDLLVAGEVAAGRLVTPFSLKLPIRAAYYLVHPAAEYERDKVRAFREWLLMVAAKETGAQRDSAAT